MRPRAAGPQRLHEAGGAQQVRLRRQVGRVVELHVRVRVDTDIAPAQLLAVLVAESKAVAAEVDLDHGKLGAGQLRKRVLAQLFLQPFESGAREHLALQALRRRRAGAGSNREVDASDVRNRAEALLDDRLAEKAGAAGDQDGLALQGLGNHDRLILVSEGSVTQSGNSHDVRTGAVGPTEIRSCGDPEPVALAALALERRRAVAPRARPRGSSSILRNQVDGEAHGSGAAPPYVDDRGVSLARSRAHGHARQLDRRESWRAPEPEIARVLAPWVGIRAAPAIWVHGAAAVHVIDAEVQVWAGGGAGHGRDADDLTAPDILPLRHVDARQVTVEGEQPVAVVDLDRLSAQARFAARDEPVGQD